MPVEGYENKHLWLYRSKVRHLFPLAPSVDPDWDDPGWQLALVEGLRRDDPVAPHSLALGDLVLADDSDTPGWGRAIWYSQDADRTGSPTLNDFALAQDAALREERKREYAKALNAENAAKKVRREKREADEARRLEARRAAEAERAEQDRIWREKQAERERVKAERDAEWERLEKRLEKWRTEAGEQKAAKRRFDEERAILMNKWQCVKCKRVAHIKADGDGYLMSCAACGIEGRGSHRTLAGMLP